MAKQVINEIVLEGNVTNNTIKEKLNEIIAINEENNTLDELIKKESKELFLLGIGELIFIAILLFGSTFLLTLLKEFNLYAIIVAAVIDIISISGIILLLTFIIKILSKKVKNIKKLNENEKDLYLKCEVYNSLNQLNTVIEDKIDEESLINESNNEEKEEN